MATLQDYRDERLKKRRTLLDLGFNLYPSNAHRSHLTQEVLEHFAELENSVITVTGRIKSLRKFGKIAFVVLEDFSGRLQLFLQAQAVAPTDATANLLGMSELNLLDSGDFIEATGRVIKTQTGEISVGVEKLRLLTKSLRPLPNEQDGFTDKEQRLRRRYVDMNVNPEVRERFVRRSKFWQATREFLNVRGFLEINIPVLEHTTGGADANPFVTHMDALGEDFYLRISHELPLKRLLVAGYEKVYDIGPRFRNEGLTDEHLPEHVAMEWYWAYADWRDGMRLTQEMIRYLADKVWGKRQFRLANGMEIDLGDDATDFPLVSFSGVIKEKYGLDVFTCTLEQVKEQLQKYDIEVEKSENKTRGIDKLWKNIRNTIAGPAFLVDVPDFLQPLAKLDAKDKRYSQQFNLLLGGTEACKAYSELNDPVLQLDNFQKQQAMRDAGDNEAMMLDIDYIEALEYGMPPACGYGNSERLFWLLEGVSAREGVPFPQLRHEIDNVTKKIYPDVKF